MDLEISRPWTPIERSAWAPPDNITVSEWSERHRMLPKQSAIPGPWSNRLVPYAVGVMDSFLEPGVERITIMASVQSSKTESAYNMLGYVISQDPAPFLVVMPTDKTLRRVNKRLQDMITESPELSRYLTGDPDDLQKRSIVLNRMEIYFATAGSKADLANVEARYLLMDEPDRYPAATGDEGSPVEMAEARLTTYWNRKIIEPCTPTTPDGHINREYQRSDRRKFWVPCLHCGGFQVLSFWQVKCSGEKLGEWPADKRDPDFIRQQRVARYECAHCQVEIDDKDKPGMLARGKWVPEGHPFDPQTGELPTLPPVSHVGFWWNVLYSPFRNFSEVAAQFFATRKDREKYKTFVNLWLAEPWKEIIEAKNEASILQLRTSRPEFEVPEGALGLTAGIDNQRRGCWVSIWAWVRRETGVIEQHLVRYGYVGDFTELGIWLFQDIYTTKSGVICPIRRGGMDIGGGEGEAGDASMTEQVYQWLRLFGQGCIFGVKGSSRLLGGGKKIQVSLIDKMPGKGKPIPGGLKLLILDTNALKDAFWSRVAAGQVHLHASTDDRFASHLAAEVKERDRRGREVWAQQGNRPNHLLDTVVYASAVADPECWGGAQVWRPLPTGNQAAAMAAEERINPFTGQKQGDWLRR